MLKDNISDLMSFIIVAQEKSFTKAAARIGISQSALSHSMRNLEERLGVRLLTRTTRSVSATEIGEKLLTSMEPHLQQMQAELVNITQQRDKPSGNIRITTVESAANFILWPKLDSFLKAYPDIHIEISINYGLVDIVSERFDAGIRLGEQIAKDMIAVRVGPNISMAAVASPDYFENKPQPQKPQDLLTHNCINMRMPTSGGLYAWEFEEKGREIRIRVDGQLVFNSMPQIIDASLRGFGIAYVPKSDVIGELNSGRLVQVLEDYCPPFPGFFLYYPSRRQHTPAFALFIEALRYHQ